MKPTVSASHVSPPALQRGEFIYGITSPEREVRWGIGSSGKIWLTGDAEPALSVKQSPTAATLQDIAAWNRDEVVAVGDAGTILTTHDAGRSWSRSNVALSPIANKLVRVRIFDDGSAWVVGEMGTALRSTDRGATSFRVTPEEDKAWNDVFVSGHRVWLVGEFGRISMSTEDGRNWLNLASPVKSSLMAIKFRDEQHGVAVGVDGAVVATSDGGANWADVRRVTSTHLYDLTWDGTRWLAFGDAGILLIGDTSGANWRKSSVTPENLQWHTKIIRDGQRFMVSGASLNVVDAR